MPEFCTLETDGRVLLVTLDRPEVMNALHPPANLELAKVFDDFASNPELWVAILTGAGERAFSAGNDLKYQAESSGRRLDIPPSGFAGLTSRFDLVKPVIAAVNGVAMGGGFEIVLACDIVIAADHAQFALPEPRVGLAALAGGLHRLPRQIPLKHAMGMILTGRRVSAAEALTLGIANQVVPQAELMATARRWADEILLCSPVSVRTSKRVVAEGLEHASLQEAMTAPTDAIRELVTSDDFLEGPRAFAEKRKPEWKAC